MLYPRIIPCLLVHDKGLVKTVQFKNPTYVGDPINAVKIFNEKQVDELMVIDIDATVQQSEPDYTMIARLAAECNMPLCYGGGIKTPEQAYRILSLGVEKIALSSAAIENPELVKDIASAIGIQSVVIVLDVKQVGLLRSDYMVYIRNGKISTQKNLFPLLAQFESIGVGELVINSIDHDGMTNGYDMSLVKKVRDCTELPLTILGGAGTLSDIGNLIQKYKVIGAAAGSLFVFKGKYRAVLINYPNPQEKEDLIKNNLQ